MVSQLKESCIDALAVLDDHTNGLLISTNKSTSAKWLNACQETATKHAIEEEMYLYKVHGCASEEETVIERANRIINPSTMPHGMASDVLDILPLVS